MEIFKANDGHVYVAFPKKGVTKDEAVKIANKHFKCKKSLLLVQTGRVSGGGYVLKIGVVGKYWVVSRRGKHE